MRRDRVGGIGAAAGPLIGGPITTAISWRAAFIFQAMVIAAIVRPRCSPSSSFTSAVASAEPKSPCSPHSCSATAPRTLGLVTQNVQWLLLMGTALGQQRLGAAQSVGAGRAARRACSRRNAACQTIAGRPM
jgi:MFS family permease